MYKYDKWLQINIYILMSLEYYYYVLIGREMRQTMINCTLKQSKNTYFILFTMSEG